MLQEVGGVWDVCERGRVCPMKLIKLTGGARNQFYLPCRCLHVGGGGVVKGGGGWWVGG